MPFKTSAHRRTNAPYLTLGLGLLAVLVFFIASGFIAYSNTRTMNEDAKMVARTHNTLLTLTQIMSIMKDAETGQRGYILTGETAYLAPYDEAVKNIRAKLIEIDEYTKDAPDQVLILDSIKASIADKFAELDDAMDVRRSKGLSAAIEMVKTDKGKAAMDSIRENIEQLQEKERQQREERIDEMARAYRTASISGFLTALSGALLAIVVAALMGRSLHARQKQSWLNNGQMGLAAAMLGDQRTDQLGENILKFFAEYFGAHAGAFFVKDGPDYKRVATYGVPKDNKMLQRFDLNDGLLGQAAKDKRAFIVRDVPDGYLSIGSAMGQDKPRHLVISTAGGDNITNTVLELGFLNEPDELSLQLLADAAEPIGVAVRAADYRAHLQDLLEETQRQSEELQTQSEELRVSNEELEEQSRALKNRSSASNSSRPSSNKTIPSWKNRRSNWSCSATIWPARMPKHRRRRRNWRAPASTSRTSSPI